MLEGTLTKTGENVLCGDIPGKVHFGIQGPQGDPAVVTDQRIEYQASESGVTIPMGVWKDGIPQVAPGNYLWTRTTVTFNSGSPVISYSVSRMGRDGSGSVSSVANISPDESGNIPLKASDVGALSDTGGTMNGPLNMNGQKLSGLNAPTEDDEAATKKYVDTAKPDLSGYATTSYVNTTVKKAAPRNLLDNSDFRNPVMQAGFCGYHGTVLYPIDRWYDRYGFGMFTRTDKGITVAYGTNHGYLNQQVNNHEKLSGKKLTLAFCDYDGNIYIASGLWNTVDSPLMAKVNADCEFSFTREGFVQFVVTAGSVGLQWGALYEGEYTIDTLPEYQPKGYGAELAECQRYYRKFARDGYGTYLIGGLCTSETNATFEIRLDKPMRVAPTVTFNGSFAINSNAFKGTSLNAQLVLPDYVKIRATASDLVVGYSAALQSAGSNSSIELSADL